jgi:hypothetical protein
MSDTSPKDTSSLTWDHVASTRTGPAPTGVEVWRLTLDRRVIGCELRNETRIGAGFDVCHPPGLRIEFLAALSR